MRQRIKPGTSNRVDKLADELEQRWETGDGLPVSAITGMNGRRLNEIHAGLARRVTELEAEVIECRRLNQRLSDVIDVVTEVLVPSLDRDDARLERALARLEATGAVDPAMTGRDVEQQELLDDDESADDA